MEERSSPSSQPAPGSASLSPVYNPYFRGQDERLNGIHSNPPSQHHRRGYGYPSPAASFSGYYPTAFDTVPHNPVFAPNPAFQGVQHSQPISPQSTPSNYAPPQASPLMSPVPPSTVVSHSTSPPPEENSSVQSEDVQGRFNQAMGGQTDGSPTAIVGNMMELVSMPIPVAAPTDVTPSFLTTPSSFAPTSPAVVEDASVPIIPSSDDTRILSRPNEEESLIKPSVPSVGVTKEASVKPITTTIENDDDDDDQPFVPRARRNAAARAARMAEELPKMEARVVVARKVRASTEEAQPPPPKRFKVEPKRPVRVPSVIIPKPTPPAKAQPKRMTTRAKSRVEQSPVPTKRKPVAARESSSSSEEDEASSEASAPTKRPQRRTRTPAAASRKDDDSSTDTEDWEGRIASHDRDFKSTLVGKILARWWYVMDDWPPPTFDFAAELKKRKLKQVSFDQWEVADDIDLEGFTKVYEITHFPGMYRNPEGSVIDLRPLEGKPSYSNLIQMPEEQLKAMLATALRKQLRALEDTPYAVTDRETVKATREDLMRELRRLEP
eukprot:Protomagalhaensia_sp_Gyna_25__3718@NODE_333_length_3839_cov_163_903947_g260_i0_p1_GENE_NODE_333_length_3839_cov_163_903947_g260_i0NODE_333_length_3839_cov_163_903947_g260_i0_p1_ORF_typecomplete_len552_score105_06_NODE_333_length_3839_cov_163_903947_g260_i09542609